MYSGSGLPIAHPQISKKRLYVKGFLENYFQIYELFETPTA